ncbi:hypothetical protein ACGFX4_03825 [Kitasatospora sp. NPDC048365]|uniref:hypothetical protein n=1 Tax=Kitasatospora sp. NPDC048365 TaxID=3364050 RepID=UPI0037221913
MTNSEKQGEQRNSGVRVSLIGGTRLEGEEVPVRTVSVSLVGGADIDLTEVDIPDGAELKITKVSLVGGVHLTVRRNVRVVVRGIRLGGVSDDGPSGEAGPTVHVDAWGLVGGVRVTRV